MKPTNYLREQIVRLSNGLGCEKGSLVSEPILVFGFWFLAFGFGFGLLDAWFGEGQLKLVEATGSKNPKAKNPKPNNLFYQCSADRA